MSRAESGKVYLVGAGPGDPELLTRKAASLLESADIVLHDDLVPPAILTIAGPQTLVANVGKRCGKKRITQAAIHALMVSCARKGMSVVRLKCGDPTIFGRAGEEIEALKSSAIEFEIVPGISAAFAAAAAARISLTDRRSASRVIFATGHLAEEEQDPNYWAEIVHPETTLVVYMPGPDLKTITTKLRQAGLSDEMPCLLISRASHTDQREQQSTLGELPTLGKLEPPTILMVGEVTRAAQKHEITTLLGGTAITRSSFALPASIESLLDHNAR